MLLFSGSSSLSTSKRSTLLTSIKSHCINVESIDGVYIHLVKLTSHSDSISSHQRKFLETLLDYGDDDRLPGTSEAIEGASHNIIYVLPRPGSISPWSSKATDIAIICNLGQCLERIEIGRAHV